MMFDGWNPHSFGVSFMEIQMFFGDFMVFFYGISMGIYDGIIYIYTHTIYAYQANLRWFRCD